MELRIADNKRRIVLSDAQPGEVYEVKHLGGGVYHVKRQRPGAADKRPEPVEPEEED